MIAKTEEFDFMNAPMDQVNDHMWNLAAEETRALFASTPAVLNEALDLLKRKRTEDGDYHPPTDESKAATEVAIAALPDLTEASKHALRTITLLPYTLEEGTVLLERAVIERESQ